MSDSSRPRWLLTTGDVYAADGWPLYAYERMLQAFKRISFRASVRHFRLLAEIQVQFFTDHALMTNSGERFSADEIALVPLDELGRRLTVVLDRLGTRRNASQIADRSVDQLTKYEKGKVEPPFSGVARLCLAAGVRMEWLATGEEPMLRDAAVASQGVAEPKAALGLGSQSARPDADRLQDALELIDRALALTRRKPRSTASKAQLVLLAYEALAEDDVAAALRRIMTAVESETGEGNEQERRTAARDDGPDRA